MAMGTQECTSDYRGLGLTPAQQEVVDRFGFDFRAFSRLRELLAGGQFPLERNRVVQPVEPCRDEDLEVLPPPGSAEAGELEELGREAIAAGRVGVVVLNGGMATRFGGGVKGIVEVAEGRSFIGWKLKEAAEAAGNVSVFLLCSFATLEATRAHLSANAYFGLDPSRAHLLGQHVSVRLTPQGDVFLQTDGTPSLYAPGHGDLFEVLAASPAVQAFAEGDRVLMVSNVDNLGATLSPRVIGAHLRSGRKLTVELADRGAGDKGGAPVRVDGRVVVLEGFRFPAHFSLDELMVFNTNTMLMHAEVARSQYDLTWFRADKNVSGQAVVQFERLMGEVTSFVEATYLVVPRIGSEGRFMPVKTPGDLDGVRQQLLARLDASA